MSEIVDFVKDYYVSWGYLIVLVGAYLENTALLGLLLPGGTLILLGAFYAKLGYLWFPAVIALGVVGMFLGSSTDFWLGRLGLHRLFQKTRFWSKVEAGLEKSRRFMNRYGGWAIFLSHFIGHIRAFVALTAGMSGYPYRRFAIFESCAAIIWNIIFCLLGYLLADNLELVERLYARFGLGMLIVLVLALVVWRGWRFYRERKKAAAPTEK